MATRKRERPPRPELPHAGRLVLLKLQKEIDFAYREASQAAPRPLLRLPSLGRSRDRRVHELDANERRDTRERAYDQWIGDSDEEFEDYDLLQREIDELNGQVARLQEIKQSLSTRQRMRRVTFSEHATRVAMTYYNVFRYGLGVLDPLHVPMRVLKGRLQSPFPPTMPVPVHDQLRFLQANVAPSFVMSGLDTPLDVFVDQWRRYTMWFDVYEYALESLHVHFVADGETDRSTDLPADTDGGVALQIRANARLGFKRETIENVFPHILWNESLVQQLLGQEVHVGSDVRFCFTDKGQIYRYDDETYFLEALTPLIRDPRDLALIMGEALVDHTGLIHEPDL
ncbi:hypothetical protein Poli38472_012524 [Pythium oligandrum]|uniref:Uncharacterized protein n=1 Tax=Pythium oligandrum TaxID=41045 RepID=A0A8K1FK32_PYTOL|nr:hypothetical protein Poli38472_012524 [Pythium oligandrum]|eukprot:TMW61333.1 hypothetical protein Poli38472_012524 [Pythium oligandrum]